MRFTVVDTERSGGGNGNWRCNRFQPKPIDRSSHLNTIKTLVKFQERRAHPLSVRNVPGLSVLSSDQPVLFYSNFPDFYPEESVLKRFDQIKYC